MNLSIGKCLGAACLIAPLIAPVWLYFKWTNSLDDFYRQQLPAEVEVADLVYVDSGIRGSCGAAIFDLAPRSKARLSMLGGGALAETVPKYAFDTGPGISRSWKETPYIYSDNESPSENYWAITLSCTWLGKEAQDKINGALSKPGSFFRRSKEGVILVVPSAGMVAYLFFD